MLLSVERNGGRKGECLSLSSHCATNKLKYLLLGEKRRDDRYDKSL